MNEADWLSGADPDPMLAYLDGRASARKLRLFACGCCRRMWGLLTNPCGRQAVDAAERFADGLATKRELRHARAAVAALPTVAEDYILAAEAYAAAVAVTNPDALTAAREAVAHTRRCTRRSRRRTNAPCATGPAPSRGGNTATCCATCSATRSAHAVSIRTGLRGTAGSSATLLA
jgi:hypothetical protein